MQGIKIFNIKIFRGIYEGKKYPESYTNDEKTIINHIALDTREIDIVQKKINFFRRLCSAGQKSFCMDVSGKITRCVTLNKEYGNLFIGKYHLDESPRPCPVKKCNCAYEGMRLTKNQKGSAFSTLKERALEVYFRKQVLIRRKVINLINKEEE